MIAAKKTAGIFLLAVALAVFTAGGAFAQDVIGCVEFNKALFQHPKMEQVQKQLQGVMTKKEQEMRTAIEKESNDQKKQEIYNTKRREMATEEQKLIQPIYKDIDLAIRTVAQTKKITVVVEKAATFYGGIDITNDVINELKKKK